MIRRALVCCVVGLLVAACGGESHQDLRAWMQDQGKGVKGKLDPLPQVKPYEPFTYNAFDLPDPFKPRKIEPAKGGSKLSPDLNRRKEPLESYPLESLQMVGTLQRGKNTFALLRTTDKVRFNPDGTNPGSGAITYRAWDQTSGSVGSKISTVTSGGTSAFSAATDVATIITPAANSI